MGVDRTSLYWTVPELHNFPMASTDQFPLS